MTKPINNSSTQSFLLTPLKIVKSIGWVVLAILALPSSLVGYKHSCLLLGKAVAVWDKNENSTVEKIDKLIQHSQISQASVEVNKGPKISDDRKNRMGDEEFKEFLKKEKVPSSSSKAKTTQAFTDKDNVCIQSETNGAVGQIIREQALGSSHANSSAGMPIRSSNNNLKELNARESLPNNANQAPKIPFRNALLSVGDKIEIKKYANQEWSASTPKAKNIKKGYSAIKKADYKNIQKIRGDNYCGLRASLYQALRLGIALPSAEETLNILQKKMQSTKEHWMLGWSFAKQSELIKELDKKIEGDQKTSDGMVGRMKFILKDFEGKTANFPTLPKEERNTQAYNLLNREEGDVIFMEALKLHMMAEFLRLYQTKENNQEVPEFAYVMFAYEETETPEKFMINTLNHAGDTKGLLQQEMCLLGHILAPIKVFRPGSYGDQWDFVNVFPVAKENQDINKFLVLVSEDNRHYNVAI